MPRGVRRLLRLPMSESRLVRELDDEVRFHLDACVDELRAAGLSEDDARVAALARFGNADDLKAYCAALSGRRERRRRLGEWIDGCVQDVRFATRQLAREPGFAVAAVLMLALGIGANTAIFSVVHRLLIAPLPFADGNRMVELMATSGGGRILITPTQSLADAWKRQARAVEQVTIFQDGEMTLGDTTRGPGEKISAAPIQPDALDYVGARPILGRGILPSDTVYDAAPVVLLGYGLWDRDFAASPSVLGTTVVLDGKAHTVIGVLPKGFFIPFADARDAFTALPAGAGDRAIRAIAKLRPGSSVETANRELAALFAARSEHNSYDDPPRAARQVDLTSRTTKQIVVMLFGAVSFVLLIACANVANLLLARAWSRQREFAVRSAMGAGRARLVRQVFTESSLLALIGGGLGIAVAVLTLRLTLSLTPNPELADVRIDRPVLLWSLALSMVTGMLFGVAPALFAGREHVGDWLKSGTRTAAGSAPARRFRAALVVLEVGLSVVLLVGTGLLVRTLVALHRVDVGFQSRGLVGVSLRMRSKRLAEPEARQSALFAALDGARRIPGVRNATYAIALPPDFAIGMGTMEIEGRPTGADDTLKVVGINIVGPEFFQMIGLPVKRGRAFSAVSGNEVMINELFARRFWPNGDAVGARIRRGERGPWATVVGVVGDVRVPAINNTRGKDLQMYEPRAAAQSAATLIVRSDLPVATLAAALTKAVHDADPSIELVNPRSAEEYVARSMGAQRFILLLLGAFASVALLLAAIGLHAVIAYSVTQRTREIGVRVALGAESGDVVGLVIRQGLALATGGIAIGAAGAVAATRALRTLLYDVQPGDPLTVAAVSALLLGIAAAATYLPARRAARLDPVAALRAE